MSQFPCMRMEQAANRDELIRRYAESVDGVIYHTVQFCDNYAYEYAWLKSWLDETYAPAGDGLYKTELRTDPDADRGISGVSVIRMQESRERRWRERNGMYVLGIDSGSTSTNAVIMDQDRKIRAFSVVRTGAKSGDSADKVLKEVLEKAALDKRRYLLDRIYRIWPGQHSLCR